MTTPNPAKAAASKPAAKATKPTPAKKVAEGKIDHTACYAAKLHEATPAGRSLCRAVRAEGKPLTKASVQVLAKTAAKKQPAKKAAPRKARETSSEDDMVSLATPPADDHEGDDPYDEADTATAQ